MKKNKEWAKRQVADREFNSDGGELHLDVIRTAHVYKILNQLDEPEVLSQEWIDEHAKAVTYDGIPDQTEVVYVDDLQNLLVPKQEEVDKGNEPETVADVIVNFSKSLERFNEVLSKKVEELE